MNNIPFSLIKDTLLLFAKLEFDKSEGTYNLMIERPGNLDRNRKFLYEQTMVKFINDMTEKELDKILDVFEQKVGYREIHLMKNREDFIKLFCCIHESKEFLSIETYLEGKGYSKNGIYVKDRDLFYSCDYGGHWKNLKLVLKELYPQMYDTFVVLEKDNSLDELDGYERTYIETFVLENFVLVGGAMNANFYINNSKQAATQSNKID